MDKIQFDFTKTEYLRLCEEAMLNELQTKLFEDKIKRTYINRDGNKT